MKTLLGFLLIFLCCSLISLPVSVGWADGGYVSKSITGSVAISADQRAIIMKKGDEISITFSTGYTGDGEDFGWIIPTPEPPAIEDVYEAGEDGVAAFEFLDFLTAPIEVTVSYGGCFPAGTEVLTANGPEAIETIEVGTQVYSYDLQSGKWILAKVSGGHVVQYRGDLITIETATQTFQATGNHPFYILSGDGLESRPLPQDISRTELKNSGPGRWVEAGDLISNKSTLTGAHHIRFLTLVKVHRWSASNSRRAGMRRQRELRTEPKANRAAVVEEARVRGNQKSARNWGRNDGGLVAWTYQLLRRGDCSTQPRLV